MCFYASCRLVVYCPFELSLFWVYEKYFMEINKLLFIIHKFVNIVYEKTVYYKHKIFISKNL